MADMIQICSEASVLVGGNPITGFDQGSEEAIVAETLYESTLLDLLASYRWRFACRVVDLNRTADTEDDFYSASYQMPVDTTMIHAVRSDHRNIEFDVMGDKIRCNSGEAENLSALVGFRPSEGDFPPYFVTVLKFRLAALFAVPLAEDPNKASLYEGMAIRAFAQARSIESQGRTARKLPVGGLRRLHGGAP